MSSVEPAKTPETRTDILRAARSLLEEHGYHGVGMERIARSAGVTRQSVYLHFGSKGALLLSLVEWIDRAGPLPKLLRRVQEAPTALEALDRMMEAHARYDPQILKIAMVLASARLTDEAARSAWDDRMQQRHSGARFVVERLAGEGFLAEGITVADATDILWTLGSIQTCEQLVVTRGWSTKRYERHLKRTARAALTQSPGPA